MRGTDPISRTFGPAAGLHAVQLANGARGALMRMRGCMVLGGHCFANSRNQTVGNVMGAENGWSSLWVGSVGISMAHSSWLRGSRMVCRALHAAHTPSPSSWAASAGAMHLASGPTLPLHSISSLQRAHKAQQELSAFWHTVGRSFSSAPPARVKPSLIDRVRNGAICRSLALLHCD